MSIPTTPISAQTAETATTTPACPSCDHELVGKVLNQFIPELREQQWHLLSSHVTDVQSHRQKRLVCCQICYRHTGERRMRKADLIIKYSDERGGETAYGALQQLLAAHFTSPFRYRVPRPYGYGREPALLIQERVQGNQWIRLLLDHPSDSHWASDRAARWLVRLQKTALAAPHLVSEAQHETVAGKMSAQIQALATSFPSAAARLNTIGHLLQQHDAFWEETPRVPSHGDYHAGNVLLTATTTTVIDFDAFGLRGPSFDVGYCIAQLLSMSYFRTGCLAPGAQAATRFWRTYRRYGGGATWPKVASWVSLTLLHNLHYTLCAMHAEQGHILPWWLDMIERWASAHTPEVLERFSQG